ncbi:MFS transporter [Alteribacillus iranensis]|uniref:Predicted arabinose efflux permease, MFS family n=1 Tax=Alteribacillus iranensis TaxID=930128 RepID=A0A1I2C3U4_9BACI|nr:MFS transporter [Alteribacillus iranensis]SFE62433.1 Predicted arabinose efflux permease, MFS family [Alteribacillus iranensis]
MSTMSNKIWTKDFIGISLIQFIVFTIFYTLLTALPLYVVQDLGKTEVQGGLAGTAMLLSAIIVRPLAGKFVEQFGKKNVLTVTVLLFTATTAGYIWADGFTSLIILRFIHGLFFGVLTTATPVIAAHVIPEKKQGEGLGYFTMAMNVAVVAGPFLGLSLIQFVSFETLFIILSIAMTAGILCLFGVTVKEDNVRTPKKKKQSFSVEEYIEWKAAPVALMSGLVAFAYAGILSFISTYATNLNMESMSSYFFLIFAVTMLLSRPFMGRLFDTRGPKIVIIPSLVIFASGLALLSVAHAPLLFLVAAGLIGVGYGAILPCTLSIAVQSSSRERNGQSTATYFMLYDTGIAAGSYVLGVVVSTVGYSLMYTFSAALVILTAIGFYYLLQGAFTKQRETKMTAEGKKSL